MLLASPGVLAWLFWAELDEVQPVSTPLWVVFSRWLLLQVRKHRGRMEKVLAGRSGPTASLQEHMAEPITSKSSGAAL